jgi:rhamnulokinase
MKATRNFLAIDLGASSGRVSAGLWDGEHFELRELNRFANAHVSVESGLHWDVLRMWSEIKQGMLHYKGKYLNTLAGIGVDAWGVDFALLDRAGRHAGNPYSHRDARTNGTLPGVFARVTEAELFRETGVQSWQINTLFQLFSMVESVDPQLAIAHTLLMMPDLFSYWLSGVKSAEFTDATTSEMLRRGSRNWAVDLLSRLKIPVHILPPIVEPGTVIGGLRSKITAEMGFASAPPVIATASHDTASAVAAIPGIDANSAFISSGTWSLMGVEVSAPITTEEARLLGFTNEGGFDGSVLLLRNITGLWLLQECMRQWRRKGVDYTWDQLLSLANRATPFRSLVDPDATEFTSPDDMIGAVQDFCRQTGQPAPENEGEVALCCLESLSLRYRSVLDSLEKITERRLETIRVVGGGSQNRLLCQLTANACGRMLIAGPVEASSLGNIMLQAVATGDVSSLEEGRRRIAASVQQSVFEPSSSDAWEESYHRFLTFSPGSYLGATN